MGFKNFVLGIIPLLIIWIVANFLLSGWVEQDLTSRGGAAVASAAQSEKRAITVAGRDVTFADAASSSKIDTDTVKAADDTFGVRLVNTKAAPIGMAKAVLAPVKAEDPKPTVVVAGRTVEVITPAACQPQLAAILAKQKILFDTGEASIDQSSGAVLKDLTETAMRCPDANIEISGHTDTVGQEDSNQRLSQARAQSVADYLIKAGIPAKRLTAVGYGTTRAIASNDTEDGRAQNRRIEFQVK